jgi:pimeloyl-ACP methyl ester carboxylesterase
VCVVGSPAVLAGNSIGGFISASAAADYPSLVAGLALLNSAGVFVCIGIKWTQIASRVVKCATNAEPDLDGAALLTTTVRSACATTTITLLFHV